MRRRAGVVALAFGAAAALLAVLWSLLPTGASLRSDGQATGGRDPDAIALERMADLALRRAQEVAADVVLRQVYVDLRGEGRTFQFVDGAAIQDIVVVAPSSTAPPDQWQITLPPDRSPLTGHVQPGLDLAALQTGPAAAVRGITKQWPGC